MAQGLRGSRSLPLRQRSRARALVSFVVLTALLTPWGTAIATADERTIDTADEGAIDPPEVIFEEFLGTVDNTVAEPDTQGVTAHLFGNATGRSFFIALRDSEPCSLPEGAVDVSEGRGLRLTGTRATFDNQTQANHWIPSDLPEYEVHYASATDLVVEVVEHWHGRTPSNAVRLKVECLAQNGRWEEAARVQINLAPYSQALWGGDFPLERFSTTVSQDNTIPLELHSGIGYVDYYDPPLMEEISAELDGRPLEISADDDTFGNVLIPQDTEPGLHILTLRRDHQIWADFIDLPVIVGFAAPDPPSSPEPVAPQGLPRVDELRLDPLTLAVAATATLGLAGLISLIGFPSDLFNKSVEADRSHPRRRWWTRLRGLLTERPRQGGARFSPRAGLVFVFFWVLAAALPVFVNWRPDKPDATPGLDFAGMLVAVFAVTMLYSGIVNVRDWRWSNVPGRFQVLLPGVVIVVICAAISFVSEFEPGYFYGLIAGFVAVADRRANLDEAEPEKDDFVRAQEGRSTLAGAAALWVLCLACYVAWSGVNAAVEQGVGGMVLEVLDKALFATTVLGLQTAVFGLVPLRFMDGHRLWRWNKRVWVLAYAPGVFLFVYLLHLHTDRVLGTSVPESLRSSLILFLGFATLSVAVWLFAYVREQRRLTPTPPPMVRAAMAPLPPPTLTETIAPAHRPVQEPKPKTHEPPGTHPDPDPAPASDRPPTPVAPLEPTDAHAGVPEEEPPTDQEGDDTDPDPPHQGRSIQEPAEQEEVATDAEPVIESKPVIEEETTTDP